MSISDRCDQNRYLKPSCYVSLAKSCVLPKPKLSMNTEKHAYMFKFTVFGGKDFDYALLTTTQSLSLLHKKCLLFSFQN